MSLKCPYCDIDPSCTSDQRRVRRIGRFWRKSDGRFIQRFYCLRHRQSYSLATPKWPYRQNKRHLNFKILKLKCENMSGRAISRYLNISRTTVARKLIYLAKLARMEGDERNLKFNRAQLVQFDEMESFEHTKCKPLSAMWAVEGKTRRILGYALARMPAKGLLAKKSQRKYGQLPDERSKARSELFKKLQELIAHDAVISSDMSPLYPRDVKRYFPFSHHVAYKGRKPADHGQGEMKKGGYDPLFAMNHTAAMVRAHISRMIRETWCTTKRMERLDDHFALYMYYHNRYLLKKPNPQAA